MRRAVAGVAAVLIVVALGWWWVFGVTGDTACVDLYPNLPEGSAYHEDVTLWPPGIECVYELPNGREETRSRFP